MQNSFNLTADLITLRKNHPDKLIDLLMDAIRARNLSAIGHIIDAGIDLNALNSAGYTALHWAARNGHTDVVKLLVNKGAKLDILNKDGNTALHLAARNGRIDVVKLLVDQVGAGLDLNALNSAGETALHLAVRNGRTDVVKLLVDKGAKLDILNNAGNTALHLAAYYGHNDAVKFLRPPTGAVACQRPDKTPIDETPIAAIRAALGL